MLERENIMDVIVDDTLSIDDLSCLSNEGASVLRSAHVGNMAPYNLSLAEVGIQLVCVDQTITGVDRNYFPESVITQSQTQVVAPVGKLVCRTFTNSGQPLDELHVGAMKEAFNNAKVITFTDYLRANEPVAAEVINLALDEFPAMFDRIAAADGSVARDLGAASLVEVYGIMQLKDDPRAESPAVMIPNVVNIVLNFVIEALRSGQERQYHLSGPDMVRYVGNLVPDMQKLYELIGRKASFKDKLPKQMIVKLVPTAQAKFATTKLRKPMLDSLLAEYDHAKEELAIMSARRKEFFAGQSAHDNAARANFIGQAKQLTTDIETKIAARILEIPELFIEPGKTTEPGFVTQYDVLEEGGLYVAPINTALSMAQLSEVSCALKGIGKRIKL